MTKLAKRFDILRVSANSLVTFLVTFDIWAHFGHGLDTVWSHFGHLLVLYDQNVTIHTSLSSPMYSSCGSELDLRVGKLGWVNLLSPIDPAVPVPRKTEAGGGSHTQTDGWRRTDGQTPAR